MNRLRESTVFSDGVRRSEWGVRRVGGSGGVSAAAEVLDSLRKCTTFSGVAPSPECGLLFLCSAWTRELRRS
jgi:hypothetical protein